jgi:hypothetical protein
VTSALIVPCLDELAENTPLKPSFVPRSLSPDRGGETAENGSYAGFALRLTTPSGNQNPNAILLSLLTLVTVASPQQQSVPEREMPRMLSAQRWPGLLCSLPGKPSGRRLAAVDAALSNR